MKTTLFALNEKINVSSDIRNDIDSHKAYMKTSETQRTTLQAHIVKTSETITVETAMHDEKHQSKILEIKRLQDEVESLKMHISVMEIEHQQNVEGINKIHYRELKSKCDHIEQLQATNMMDHDDKDTKYTTKLKRLQQDHAAELKKL